MNNEPTKRIPTLTEYALLGKSGLRVSPLCLGTMTFGTDWGWGAPKETAVAILNRYVEAGGNFIDTADGYTNTTSESIIGDWFSETKRRDEVVLATKFSFSARPGDPNAGGNSRKNIYRALEGSLRRLKTDYIDLYWLHAWDTVTPVEEVISTMNDLVRTGKIRHYGFSDTPAWYVARAQTLAQKDATEPLIALQLEYSLVERTIEREHVPTAQELGIAICPWSPLAGGFLSGKYKREKSGHQGEGQGRLTTPGGSPFNRFSERNWRVLDALLDVAKQLNKPPAQVALNWVATQPGITSTIVGATKVTQLDDNLASIDFVIPTDLRKRLDEASALEPAQPYIFFGGEIQSRVAGGVPVRPWMPARVYSVPVKVAAKVSGKEQ
jgi:aryl-alcohol dehydrogenase-like predicted oxidoreductase